MIKAIHGSHVRNLTTVTLTAIDNGTSVTLLDCSGKRIAKIPKHVAHETCETTSRKIQKALDWQDAYAKCSKQHHGRKKRRELSGWEKQAHVWHRSLRFRRNSLRSKERKQTHGNNPARDMPKSWHEACFVLRKTYVQKLCNERRREKNHWRLWAETIYSNLRKRKDIHGQKKHGDGFSHTAAICFDTRTTGRQMCLEWSSDHASEVFA
jgi:hypothetical protein